MTNKIKNWTAAALLFLFLLPFASAQITPNIWKKFIGEPVPVGTPDLIDFSYAGYKNGTERIPENFGYTVHNVTQYGATPDDGKSDSAGIRAALDAAAVGNSIVFFPSGQYDVLLNNDVKDPFVVRGHHVIIRGSGAQGAGSDGTTIKMHNELAIGSEMLFVTPGADFDWDTKTRVNGSFPSGAKYFDVRDATQLRGHKFIVIRGFNLRGEDYGKYSSRPISDLPESYTRIRDGITLREYHEIDRIEGNRVHLKAPLVTHLSPGMPVHWVDLAEGIGFEDLHIDGGFDEVYEHLVQRGRGGISLWETAHSWIRRCRISNVITAFSIGHSYCGSAVSNIIDGRSGHNLGNIFGSTYCLNALLEDYTDRGMWHGAAVSHYSAGSVTWHVRGPLVGGPDTHGAQSRHSLFDNCDSISHHTSGGGVESLPHHLDGYTRWNNTVADSSTFDLWTPGGYEFAVTQGNLIGYKTLGGSLPRNAYFEGFGTHVSPDSLYEAQLEHRLGALPAWVEAAKKEHRKFFESIIVDAGQPDKSSDAQDSKLDLTQGGPKIEGAWLWVLVPDEHLDRTTDLLAKASGGAVTEQHIATIGALPGDTAGDYIWTSLKISDSGGDNITDMTRPLGWNGNNRVIYGFITLDSPREQNTRMFVGSDDSVKVWLNGELVREEIVGRSASDYRGSFPVTLKQGINTLLVAVENRTGGWSGFFGFRADAEYTPLAFARVGYALSNVEISTGDAFRLDIYAEDVTDLVEWQFDIAFDPTRLEALEIRKGYFLESEGVTSFEKGTIDNRSGKITGLGEAVLNGNSVSGTGLLLSVTFSAKTGGETQPTLQNFQLTSGTGRAISAGPHEVALVVKDGLIWDVNGDGHVSILDLILIARDFGRTAPVYSRTDVNSDGVITILDLILVAQHLGESIGAASPSMLATGNIIENLDPAMIQAWIELAQIEDDGSIAFQEGIAYLQSILALLVPEETALLPNYPNPFNPETWIPYQLSEPAEVVLRIYTVNGELVRTLALGHTPAGIYQSRSRAVYWDGKNDVGEAVASGIYFYSLTVGDFTATRKMLIRK